MDYRYKAVNQGFMDSRGLSAGDIVDKHVSEILGRHDYEVVVKPRLDRAAAGEEVHYFDWFERKSGEPRFLEVNYSPHRDDLGNVIGIVVNLHDITELREVQETLAERQQQLEEAQNVAQLGSYQLDLATRQVTWSDELYRLFGYDPADPPVITKDLSPPPRHPGRPAQAPGDH